MTSDHPGQGQPGPEPQSGYRPQPLGGPSAAPTHPSAATIAPPAAERYSDGDGEDMPLPKGRGSTSTKVLAVGVLLAFAFGGGVMAQKKNDEGMIRPASGPLGALGGAGAGAAAAPPGGAAAAKPEPGEHPLLAGANLKGELVSVNGTEFVVRNANGTEVKATTSATSLVTKVVALDSLSLGTKVYVAGQPAADGSTTAILVVAP